MKQKIKNMLEMQANMNQKVNPDWKAQNFAWYRAIWVESAELLDHHGWKWWKKQQPDIEQIKLELVDIWHFGLSLMLQQTTDADELADVINGQLKAVPQKTNHFLQNVETFAANTLISKGFSISDFHQLLVDMDMDFNELYIKYIGKNVLNFFRQDHGYQQGSYIKIWQGKEDNQCLVEVIATLNSDDIDFKKQIYEGLATRYRKL